MRKKAVINHPKWLSVAVEGACLQIKYLCETHYCSPHFWMKSLNLTMRWIEVKTISRIYRFWFPGLGKPTVQKPVFSNTLYKAAGIRRAYSCLFITYCKHACCCYCSLPTHSAFTQLGSNPAVASANGPVWAVWHQSGICKGMWGNYTRDMCDYTVWTAKFKWGLYYTVHWLYARCAEGSERRISEELSKEQELKTLRTRIHHVCLVMSDSLSWNDALDSSHSFGYCRGVSH